MKFFYLIVGAVCIAVFLISASVYIIFFNNNGNGFSKCRAGQVAGNIGGSFSLINEDGIVVTDRDVIKGPSLIYFGYTFCPDICPLDTYRNAEAVTLLEEDGYDVTPIFITFLYDISLLIV